MASRPMLQKFSKRVGDVYGTEDDPVGEDSLLERVAAGATIKTVAADLGVSRGQIYNWVKAGGEAREEKFRAARTLSADAMADDALEILDALPGQPLLTNAQVQAGTARANYRRWLASVRNREEYGEKAGVNVSVNIGQLHLDALKAAGHMPVPEGIPEAEIVDEGPAPEAPAFPTPTTD